MTVQQQQGTSKGAKASAQRVTTEPAQRAPTQLPEVIYPQSVEPNYSPDDEEEDNTAIITSNKSVELNETYEPPALKPKQSPMSSNILNEGRPDMSGNKLHRIVALVSKQTSQVPRLVIQQHKDTRGYTGANLELQLKEWAYQARGNWAYKNNFARAIVDWKIRNLFNTEI